MKETIFLIFKILMLASIVGLLVYILYIFNSPSDDKLKEYKKNNEKKDNVHKMRNVS